ncbi:MAG TPA: cupin domain-containing protein [Terriglobales bacterium]|nr:cupin domain-containing protein [Terriglobales bacterium]
MANDQALSASEIKELLGLKEHPTCGFVYESFRSNVRIPNADLPAAYGRDGSRAFGSVLYFLVTPDRHLCLHRIRADQMYHHYLGGPLDVLLLYPDGRGEIATVGTDLRSGMRPQLFIPGGTFHVGRLRAGEPYALLGTTEWPAVEPSDVEIGDVDRLVVAFPTMREQIMRFAGTFDAAGKRSA